MGWFSWPNPMGTSKGFVSCPTPPSCLPTADTTSQLRTRRAQNRGRYLNDGLVLVNGEAIIGANIFRDMFSSVRDVVGGRAGGYERAWRARATRR
jgi:hypothetical protein